MDNESQLRKIKATKRVSSGPEPEAKTVKGDVESSVMIEPTNLDASITYDL